MMMQTATTIEEVRNAVKSARDAGQKIGCVPTMGALHAGHLSLIKKAVEDSDFVVVTLFVNPTQFGPREDFSQYPRPLEQDLKLCQQAGADFVFHPQVESLYRQSPQIQVSVGELANKWEGESRVGHFEGVATIVTKLFNIVMPDAAFFGQKDYQQLAIIKAICVDLNLPVEITACPTIREKDGLALSSRNVYLSNTERTQAVYLNQTLLLAEQLVATSTKTMLEIRQQLLENLNKHPDISPEYVTIVDPVTLDELDKRQRDMVAIVAAQVGKTRLIDNRIFSLPERHRLK